MAKKQKIQLYELTSTDDIRYRGPLSYRHLQILAWIGISFLIISTGISLVTKVIPEQPAWIRDVEAIANLIGSLALPLFLFANFAIILDEKYSYRSQLGKFAGLSLLVVFFYFLVTKHYITGLLAALTQDKAAARETLSVIIYTGAQDGGMAFNLFIDMFLCTLFMFFLNYEPTRVFTGKKKIIFRLFSLLPLLYEIACLAIRVAVVYGAIHPPLIVYSFLTTKPLMSFVLFIILALFAKFRERKFRKKRKGQGGVQGFPEDQPELPPILRLCQHHDPGYLRV